MVGLGLGLGWLALVRVRLDRELLVQGLSRALGQAVQLQDYALSWDGSLLVSGLAVGQCLKVRQARLWLPWTELARGQVSPRRLELSEPELTLGSWPARGGPGPGFPVSFANATLRWRDYPPLQPLQGEWTPEGRLTVVHPEAGRWQWDGSQLTGEALPLRFVARWLGWTWDPEPAVRAQVQFRLGPPWQAELKLPLGQLTLREDGSRIRLESAELIWSGQTLRQVQADLLVSPTGVEVGEF